MTNYEYLKTLSVDELAVYIYKRSIAIEAAKKGIRSIGVDPDNHDTWINVIKKYLMKEVEE